MSREAMSNIASALRYMGRTKEALPIAQKVLDLNRRVEGPDEEDTLWAAHNLAIDYRMDGNLPQAESILRDVVTRARRVFIHGEYYPGLYESELGEVLALEHKPAEARTLLTESLATLTKSLGPTHRHTIHAQSLLASLPTSP